MRKTKRKLRLMLLLLAVGCMASCAAQPAEMTAYCTEEQAEFFHRIETEQPVYCIYEKNGEASARYRLTDAQTVLQMAQALQAIQIGPKAEMSSTDSDDVFTFIMADESKYSFCFSAHDFKAKDKNYYQTENDKALWTLADKALQEPIDESFLQ